MKRGSKWLAGVICAAVLLAPELSAGRAAFAQEPEYAYQERPDGTVEITKYQGEQQEVVIPSELDGKPVSGIGDHAFSNNRSLTSVTIPENVHRIGSYTFCLCGQLASIDIPAGDQELGEWAFSDTKWLNDQPDGCVYLGENDHIFYCYKGTMPENTTITVKEGTTHIAGAAFTFVDGDMVNSYQQLTAVELPQSVVSIGRRAFQECSRLSSVTIPDGLTSLGDMAFSAEQPWLEGYEDGPVYLGKVLFFYKGDRSSYTELDIRPGTTAIWPHACQESEKLQRLTIPESVKTIGDWAFADCESLTSVELPFGVETLGYKAFTSCTALTTVTIPASVLEWGGSVFNCCDNLKTVYFPGGKESFGRMVMDDYDREDIAPFAVFPEPSPESKEESSEPESRGESSAPESRGESSAPESGKESLTSESLASRKAPEAKTSSAAASSPDSPEKPIGLLPAVLIGAGVLIAGAAVLLILIRRKVFGKP